MTSTIKEKNQAKQWWSDLPDLSKLCLMDDDDHIRLSKSGKKNYLITSALPYVNNVSHLGNIIGSTLSGDVFTSEKCELFLADRYVEGVCPHCKFVDARGDQCDKCSKLLNPTDLREPRCKVCKQTPILKTSKRLFLDLPKLEPQVRQYLEEQTSKPDCKWTNTAKVIAQTWLKEGLIARCMTRDLKWGTPVPLEGYENKVFYVWYDAPIVYLSITKTLTDQWEKWWKDPENVELYQFMAKDNVPFHSVIFPAIQFGTKDKFTMVNHLIGIEYLNYEDTKFSKSRNVGVFGNDAKSTEIPADIWRFYLPHMRSESQDSSFSWSDLQLKNNDELLNNLGNIINRSLMFLAKNFDGKLGDVMADDLTDEDVELIANINRDLEEYCSLMDKVKMRDALKCILSISKHGNGHVQATSVWTLVKGDNEEDRKRALTIMTLCVNISALISLLIAPFMPTVASELRKQLNLKENCFKCDHFIQYLRAGHQISKPSSLFKCIEQKHINEYKVENARWKSEEDLKSGTMIIMVKTVDGYALSSDTLCTANKVKDWISVSYALKHRFYTVHIGHSKNGKRDEVKIACAMGSGLGKDLEQIYNAFNQQSSNTFLRTKEDFNLHVFICKALKNFKRMKFEKKFVILISDGFDGFRIDERSAIPKLKPVFYEIAGVVAEERKLHFDEDVAKSELKLDTVHHFMNQQLNESVKLEAELIELNRSNKSNERFKYKKVGGQFNCILINKERTFLDPVLNMNGLTTVKINAEPEDFQISELIHKYKTYQ